MMSIMEKTALLFFIIMTTAKQGLSQSNSNYSLYDSACVDDSECLPLGSEYACFLFFCQNWEDQSDGHFFCEDDSVCPPGSACYRHWNERFADRGMCFSDFEVGLTDHSEDEKTTCIDDSQCTEKCCGLFCCTETYYRRTYSDVIDPQLIEARLSRLGAALRENSGIELFKSFLEEVGVDRVEKLLVQPERLVMANVPELELFLKSGSPNFTTQFSILMTTAIVLTDFVISAM